MKFLTDDPGRSRVEGLIDIACRPAPQPHPQRSVWLPVRPHTELSWLGLECRDIWLTDWGRAFTLHPYFLNTKLTSPVLPSVCHITCVPVCTDLVVINTDSGSAGHFPLSGMCWIYRRRFRSWLDSRPQMIEPNNSRPTDRFILSLWLLAMVGT
jgi:hypothetical protein